MAKDKDGNIIEEGDTDDVDKGGSKDKSSSGSGGETEQERQAKFDKVAGTARGEGRTAGQKSTLESLGFETEKEALAYLKEKREADDADKSELDKLIAKVDGLEKRATDAEEGLTKAQSSALTQRLKSAVSVEIVSNKDLNITPEAADDIWLFIAQDYLGDDGIHVDENGKVQGIAEGLKKLLKAKPYFASTSDKTTPDSDTRQKKDKVGSDGEKIIDKTKSKYSNERPNPRI